MLVALLVSSLLVVQDRPPTGQPKPPGPVATVNGEPISFADWQSALGRLPPVPPGLSPQQQKALHHELLAMLIDEKLLKQYLAKAVPAPTEAEIKAKIAEVEKSLTLRKVTLQDYLRDTRQTWEQFRDGVAAELRWQTLVNQKAAGVDLKAYWEQNREMFDGVTIRVSHLVLSLPPGSDAKKVEETTQRLRSIREQIAKGLDFAEAAKQYSDDKGSAKLGGDLGYFPPRKNDTDPFMRAASLLKVGEVSDVVRSDFGLHLIKQTERKAGQPTAYEAMKDTVRAVWADELKIALIMEQRKAAKVTLSLPE